MHYGRNKNKIAFLIIVVLALTIAPFSAYSATVSEIEQQKKAKQALLDQLNAQIKQYEQQIAEQRKKGASLSNEITLYNSEIRSTEIRLQATGTSIENTALQIEATKIQIAEKTLKIEQQKAILTELIIQLNQYDQMSTLQLGLGSANFSTFMDQIQYTSSIQDRVYSLIQQIKELREKLKKDQAELEKNLDELKKLEEQLEETKTALNDQRSAKTQLLQQTRGQESRYRQLAAATEAQESAIRREIYDLDQQLKGNKNFKKLAPIKGILAWPMDGVVTQRYGNTGFTKLGYNFHNGIDVAAPAGTSIYAAADGVVNGTGTGQAAYGNWVTVEHSITKNGRKIVTIYAHMISFVVKRGQSVKRGDLIGYEGNSGNTSRLLYGPARGYHIHFGVFDSEGFGISQGKFPEVYGPYQVPYGYTYDPYDFL